MLRQLFIIARRTAKIRIGLAKNMATDFKLSKAQMSKSIQSGGFLLNMLGNRGKKSNNRLCYSFSYK